MSRLFENSLSRPRTKDTNFCKLWSTNFHYSYARKILHFVNFFIIIRKYWFLKIMNVILKFYVLAAILIMFVVMKQSKGHSNQVFHC